MICRKAFQRFSQENGELHPLHQAGDKGMLDAQDIGAFGCLKADP